MRPRLSATALVLAMVLATGCGGGSGSSSSGGSGGSTSDISGSISVMGIWSGPEQAAFQKVIDGFTSQNPDVLGEVHVRRRPAADPSSRRRSRVAIRPSVAFVAQPGLIQGLRRQERVEADRLRHSPTWYRTSASRRLDIATVDGKLYGVLLQGGPTSRLVWYNVQAYNDAGVKARQGPGTSSFRTRALLKGIGRPCVLDRRRRRVADHRPVREHLPEPGGARQLRQARRPRDPVDRPDPSRTR